MKKRGNISVEGYRKNSPDRFNDFNIIPSNEISMQNVNKNVLMIPMGGRGTGNPILAKPGERYFFPNHELVFEQAMPENAMMRYQRIAKFGGLPMAQNGWESKINKALGQPMKKAQEASKGDKWFNPKTKKWEQEDDVDNFRHPMAGRYTAEAIANKFPSWMQYTGIPQAAGFVGANALGIGHEITNPNKDPNYSWWDVVREAGEDIFNNAVGAGVGVLPMSDDKKTEMLWNLSKNNRLPDGYAKANMYFKAYGGPLPKAQMYNSQVGVIPTLDNQFIYPSNFKYEQGTPVQNRAQGCQGPNCLEGANTYYNRYIAPKFGLPDTWKMNEAYGIVSGDPNQPYGVSADSWDLASLMQGKGAIQNYAAPLYTNNVRNSEKQAEQYWNLLTPEEKKKLYSQLALGSLVNFGDYGGLHGERLKGSNEKAGLYPSRHSTRVVGYTEDRIPVIYDMGQIRRIDDPKYDFPITNITTPKELAKYNYEYVKDWQNKNQKKLEYNPKEKLLLGKKSIREGEDAFTQEENQYVEGINKNIKNLMQATGASQDDIIKAGKVAFGILEAETRGGRGSAKAKIKELAKAVTPFTSEASKGLTRIKPEMQAGDESNKYSQYMKTLGLNPKDLDLWDPEQAALATTALILSRKGDIEGVDKWYLRAQQHNTPGVGPKNEQRLKEADKDYANNVIRNASRIYSSKTGYGLPETEKWMNTKKAEKAKQEGEKVWSERFRPNIMRTESTGYIPNIPSMAQRAYGGLHKAQDGRIQAATTYASGKEQNYMSPERRVYEQSLANQLAERELRNTKGVADMAGLVFYPAALANATYDASQGNYGQAALSAFPWFKMAKGATKGGLKVAFGNTGAVSAIKDANDIYEGNPYGLIHKRKGGALPNRRETNKNIKSSINNLMRRNETLFGPAGRNFYNPNPMSKYYKGGIAFPQAPTAGSTPGQQETEFYAPNWIPRGPVGFYEHGGIAYPQQPTSDYFFSGSPWMAHYDMGGGLPGGANNMYMPCMNCGGYMEDGGMYYAQPGKMINPTPVKPTPVPAPDPDAFVAGIDQAYSQKLKDKIKKDEDYRKAHPWSRSAETTPEGAQLFFKTGQSGTPQQYVYESGAYNLYNPSPTPPPVIAKQRYGGFQEGGFMNPDNMLNYPTFSQGGDPYGYADGGINNPGFRALPQSVQQNIISNMADGGNVADYDQDQYTRILGKNFMSGVQGNMQNNIMRDAGMQFAQNPYQMPEGEYGYNMNMPNMMNAGNMFDAQERYDQLANQNKAALKNMYGAGMFALGTANPYTKYKAKKAGKGTLPGTPDMTTNPDIASNKGLNNVTTQSVQPDMTGADMTQTGMARYGAAYIPKAQTGRRHLDYFTKAADMPQLTFPSAPSASTSANPNNLSPEALAKKQAFKDDAAAYDQRTAMLNQMPRPGGMYFTPEELSRSPLQQAGNPYMMGSYPNMMGQQGQFAPNFQGMYDNFGNDDYRVGRMSRGMQNMLPYLMSNPQNTYLQEFNAKKALFGPGARKVSMKFRTVFDPRTGQQVQVPVEGKGGKEDIMKDPNLSKYSKEELRGLGYDVPGDKEGKSAQKDYEDMNMFQRMKANRQAKRMMREDERRFKGAKGSSTNDEKDFIKQAMEEEARREKKWGVQKAIPSSGFSEGIPKRPYGPESKSSYNTYNNLPPYTPQNVFGEASSNMLTQPIDFNQQMMQNLNARDAERGYVTPADLRDPLSDYSRRYIYRTKAGNNLYSDETPYDYQGGYGQAIKQDLEQQRYGGMYEEGGIHELTEDEIQQIMAAGGSVTYLD